MPSTGTLIVERLLGGYAQVQDGIIGPNQMCYTGPPERANAYDPGQGQGAAGRSRLSATAGPEIDFYTAVGRYTSDRQVAEAVAQMLRQVGFKVKLHTPEYANFWADVRRGKTPMYYMGRGTVFDASDAAGQLFGTGGSPRVQYSNPKFDELLQAQYAEADPEKRCQIWRQLNQILVDDVPEPLHVDPHADHRRARQCRRHDGVVRRVLAAAGEDAMIDRRTRSRAT